MDSIWSKIEKIAEENHGVIKTSAVEAEGISRPMLRKYVEEGKLEQVRKGLYVRADDLADEFAMVQFQSSKAIFSYGTALYLAVADVEIGAFSAIWGNNPDNDLAMPDIVRDRAKEDMIFERLDEWIWSFENDKPPTMAGVAPMELMLALFNIVQGTITTIMNAAGFGSPQQTTLPAEMVTTIEDCGFFESIPLWAVTLIGGLFITVLSFLLMRMRLVVCALEVCFF